MTQIQKKDGRYCGECVQGQRTSVSEDKTYECTEMKSDHYGHILSHAHPGCTEYMYVFREDED